ncbi:aarF domain-containing protein kinase [Pyrus ussuriensis x Pyrus communis]|uniref:AarF domain-containing protein kinase n=1 Tax=Pyrus ussuriensis x Pyrus communis TaxID=2448454 RepID=A0A5N5F7Q4_9ROSA|nr:aarF domain-containing protein kinase [Pyrus ussuriensis x Pyrus communis]
MAAITGPASSSLMISLSFKPACVLRSTRPAKKTPKIKRERQGRAVVGDFGHLGEVVRKDLEFLKTGIGRGIEWANKAFRIPEVSKAVDDVVWLRNLEDPDAPPSPAPSWPQPAYPELSGVDLLVADLKALETYALYFYYLSKIWSKPLPEVYDPESVAEYFSCRPHVVALRLIEVFSSFASAAIRIRTTEIKKFLRLSSDVDINENISQYNFGMVLKETMLSLGPTFIKVGQSLSTRPDIIGAEMAKPLSELHDQIPPFPRAMAMKIIKEELGSPAESLFSYISEEPEAAASFGQIGLFQNIANRKSDLRLYADELGKGLVGELDYTLEAANASKFQEAHSSFPFMLVPKVYQHLSRKRVLTMEWIVGESPTDLLSVSAAGSPVESGSTYSERQILDAKRRLLDLVKKGVEACLAQLLETGLLHADPHPGNLRYTSSGQIGFLDFGLLCQMKKKHQFAMLASIVHIVNGDWESLVNSLTEMDVSRPGTNLRRVTMDLEYELGEVEFRDGIPDVKFSRVLSKIWSVAFKYHFRMPPYYSLVLRSLASFEGLAVAADKNFKTFEAAYPYVVRKLLTENSAATRKILHSVVFNKRKEFQWQRLSLFLKVGATRKGLHEIIAPEADTSVGCLPSRDGGAVDVANFVLRILPSKDGVVLRRLLMTADGASLVQAMVSKEAKVYRQQFCRVIADVLYQWMYAANGRGITKTQYSSDLKMAGGPENRERGPSSRAPIYDYRAIYRDRRLRVIVSNVLNSARKNPILMLRLYWTSFIMFATAFALACHRALLSFAEDHLGPISFAPKQYAIQ